MLEGVRIENFRCLKSVDVPLKPVTILIGPNDSGKSAFLGALRLLTGEGRFEQMDHWRLQEGSGLSLVGRTSEGPVRRTAKMEKYCEGPAAQLKPAALFRLPSHGVLMSSGGVSDIGEPPDLTSDGQMVPALLDHLLRGDRERFFAFVKAMRELVPGFEDVHIATPDAAKRRVDLVIDGGLKIPAAYASAGVRLLLFFAALAYHPKPPKLILLEEPENGVHPRRLADIMRLLREVSEGKHGDQAAQIILTTHSPHLLDYVDVEKDQVLVFRRNDDGSRTAAPADAARLKNFLDEFMLGEVWFNEGEEGLVSRDT